MAPEALREESLTAATDIYSFGITLWQMKYRHLPYHDIQCNEIVAYQVVKHHLRPNTLPGIENHLKNSNSNNSFQAQYPNGHDYCSCDIIPTPISPQSLEDLLKVLRRTECELETESNLKENIPIKRLPLKDLSNSNQNIKKINVKRDLQTSFSLSETFPLAAILSQSEHLDANKIAKLERLYEDIYKSCWHDDFKRRPVTAELIKYFKEML